jgi:hypothetical protein
MTELIPHNNKINNKPKGLIGHTANTCYLASLTQCLLSCTSFWETLQKIKNKYPQRSRENDIINMLNDLYNDYNSTSSQADMSNLANLLFTNAVFVANRQEDLSEACIIFLKSLQTIPELYGLVAHPRITYRYDNNTYYSVKYEDELTISHNYINPGGRLISYIDREPLQGTDIITVSETNIYYSNVETFDLLPISSDDFIYTQRLPPGENNIYEHNKLLYSPEILIFIIMRFYKDNNNKDQKDYSNVKYPKYMAIPTSPTEVLVYRHVASAEHGGGVGGGHYMARGLRNDKFYRFNDANAPEEINADDVWKNFTDYVIFYHYIETISTDKYMSKYATS